MCYRLVLEGPLFQHYFDKVEVSNFEVASDAFSTFKVCMHPYLHRSCRDFVGVVVGWFDACVFIGP